MEERKVKSVQRYTFEIAHYEDGYSVMTRLNEGFSAIEMLGITELIKENVIALLKDVMKDTDEVNVKSTDSPIIHIPEQ